MKLNRSQAAENAFTVLHAQHLCLVPDYHQPSGTPVPLPLALPTSAFCLCGFACSGRFTDTERPTLCGHLRLAPSAQHRVFEVHPRRDVCQGFVPFCGWAVSRRVDGPRFVRPLHLVVHTRAVLMSWSL